ncbi:MAG: tryptophan synthase subunit alpha [Pontiellaceae bacterium]|jgi:tryptophan synthase alpha chain|nr:tryptophan synthase subunit alpha [Pontiellaceae bacterium]
MKNTRVDQRFAALKTAGKKGFIAYIGAGDPSLDATVDTVLRLEEAGVDLVELGLPFSDPLADGRVNQDAATRALAAGSTFHGVMDCVARIRERSQIPMIFYAYLNTLCARGFDRAMKESAAAGIDGFLVLDMPREEAGPYRKFISGANLHNIVLITPTTPEERMKQIVKEADGFVYCVSREGVTGVRDSIAEGARGLVAKIKQHTSLPVALGFGIGTSQQAAEAATFSDAVVVGSAIVNKFHDHPHTSEGRAAAAKFVAEMVRAVKGV